MAELVLACSRERAPVEILATRVAEVLGVRLRSVEFERRRIDRASEP